MQRFFWVLFLPPFDHPRRGWSPPGRDYRGRSPTREEFDRFGRPPPPRDADFFDDRGRPPPRDWDREDCEFLNIIMYQY